MLPPVLKPLRLIVEWDNLDNTQQLLLIQNLLGYILRIRKYADIKKDIKFLRARQLLDCRACLVNDWNLAVALRLAIYVTIQKKIRNMKEIVSIFLEYGLSPHDVALYLMIFNDIPKVRAKIRDIHIPTLIDLRRNCMELIVSSDIKKFVEKFVNRKLRAFAYANNYTLKDFENELFVEGVRCYYNAVPNISGDHLINHVKKSIKHHGHDLISYYKRNCRIRLIPQQDTTNGFTNTIRNFENIVIEGYDRNFDLVEMVNDYKNLLLHNSFACLRLQALQLMGLNNDPDFIKWWNRRHRKSQDSTIEIFYQHTSPEDFFSTIQKFVGVNNFSFTAWQNELNHA